MKRIAAASEYMPDICADVAAVFAWDRFKPISFLWYNLIGCVVVVAVGMLISLVEQKARP